MKTTVLIQSAWFAALLLTQCGCQTTRSGAAKIGGSEAQAEVNLAASQSQTILQDTAMTAAKAVFQSGDKIAVQIWLKDKVTQLSGFPLELDIGVSGQVFLPHVGLVTVSGKTTGEVQNELRNELQKVFNKPAPDSRAVTVTGASLPAGDKLPVGDKLRGGDKFQVGDKLGVQIWLNDKITQLSGFPLELAIPKSGEVFMPHIGMLKVAGKTVPEMQAELQNISKKILNNTIVIVSRADASAVPEVQAVQARLPDISDKIATDLTVIVARKGERTFLGSEGKNSVELGKHFIVMGRISNPGLFALEHGMRVRDAIAIAGGLAHYGHPNIFLVRGDRYKPEVKRINMNDIFFGESLEHNVLMASNDAIYVTPRLLYQIADFITLLLSPVTSVRDSLWVYDRVVKEQ